MIRWLYLLLRGARDVRALHTGRVGRRARNRAVARVLGRTGFWRRLWG